MSRERAVRRAERQRESALRAAAREAEQERARRRTARKRALTRWWPAAASRPTGILAERRRLRLRLLMAGLLAVQVLVWLFRPDWPARVAALLVSVLVFPLLLAFVAS